MTGVDGGTVTAFQYGLREAMDFAADGRERFVFGSIGPGTRLATLGQIDYDALEQALAPA